MMKSRAYRAMFNYLETVGKRNPNIEIGSLLSDLSQNIWVDGSPGDRAVSAEWESSVKNAIEG
jgi:hypothetical protein